jgi:ABC-2 type transport system permease protein
MINDVATVVWKEFRELFSGRGRGKMAPLVLLVIYGLVFPLQAGREWIYSHQVVGFAMGISIFLVLSIVADTFAGERERHTLETLLASRLSDRAILAGKIVTVVLYGWGLTMTSLIVALFAVNLEVGGGRILLYPGPRSAATVALSLLLSILSTGIGVLISLRASTVRQAQQILTIGWIALFVLIFFGAQALPSSLTTRIVDRVKDLSLTNAVIAMIALLIVIDVLVLAVDAARFQRARLILD